MFGSTKRIPAVQPRQEPLVLVVDDDADLRDVLAGVLRHEGFGVILAANGWECLRAIEENDVEAVVLDYQMPGLCGDEVLRAIRAAAPRLPVVMLSGAMCKDLEEDLIRSGADLCLMKPAENLPAAIANLIGAQA